MTERKLHGLNCDITVSQIKTQDYTRNFFEVLNKLKDNIDPWMIRFNELKAYYRRIGNTNIPQRKSPLGKFVSRLREDYKNNKLSEKQIKLLNEIEFDFSLYKSKWQNDLEYCLSFSCDKGLLPLVAKDKRSNTFYESMRKSKRKGTISNDRLFILESYGFVWNVLDFNWSNRFLEISMLKLDGNDINNYCIKTSSIGKWKYRNKHKLNKLNFSF